MSYLGDRPVASTVVLFVTTTVNGVPTTLLGSPVISAYKNSTAESTAGVTLTVDYDGRTGLNQAVINTAADGTFYAAGNDFDLVLTAGTVGGVSQIGVVVGAFSLAVSGLATAAALTTVQADTDDIQSRLPAALVGGRIDASIGAVASGIIAAASFASGALDAVWSTTTRLLSAGTNIVLAKGTGITGFNDLSAAQVNVEADTALSDVGLTSTITGRVDAAVSTRLATAGYTAPDNATILAIAAYVDTEVPAIKAKTDNLPASPAATGDIPTANANADAMLDRANGVETGWTLRQTVRIILSVLAGKASGMATTTVTFRDVGDSKDRVVATVDEDGDRSAVTLDAT